MAIKPVGNAALLGPTLKVKLGLYVKLMKPRIVLLNLMVAVAAMVAAWNGAVYLPTLLFTLLAGGLAASGASAVNAYLDKDLDYRMSRTRGRPIPSGRIHPPEKALWLGSGLIGISTLIGVFTLHVLAVVFMALGALFYILVYTVWLKRRTIHNIVIGGFAGSCSALAGSAAAIGTVDLTALLLALLVFMWTPGHFWPLALRFKEDYARARVPMLPTVVGRAEASRAIVFSNLVVVSVAILFIFLVPLGLLYAASVVLLGVVMAGFNLKFLRTLADRDAWNVFKLSSFYLMVLLLSLIADRMWGVPFEGV